MRSQPDELDACIDVAKPLQVVCVISAHRKGLLAIIAASEADAPWASPSAASQRLCCA